MKIGRFIAMQQEKGMHSYNNKNTAALMENLHEIYPSTGADQELQPSENNTVLEENVRLSSRHDFGRGQLFLCFPLRNSPISH